MFQCIIQQKNGWIHSYNTENKDVFPGILPYYIFSASRFGVVLFFSMYVTELQGQYVSVWFLTQSQLKNVFRVGIHTHT